MGQVVLTVCLNELNKKTQNTNINKTENDDWMFLWQNWDKSVTYVYEDQLNYSASSSLQDG